MIVKIALPIFGPRCVSQQIDIFGCSHFHFANDHGDDHFPLFFYNIILLDPLSAQEHDCDTIGMVEKIHEFSLRDYHLLLQHPIIIITQFNQ